ncbi:MAG TPA: DUF5658 family protein [Fimbriimonas sp.]
MAIAAICLIDTAITVVLVTSGVAVEANPLLNWSFRYGAAMFVAAKTFWFLPPLLVIEAMRARNDRFVKFALRFGLVGYLLVYFGGTLALHPHLVS